MCKTDFIKQRIIVLVYRSIYYLLLLLFITSQSNNKSVFNKTIYGIKLYRVDLSKKTGTKRELLKMA